MTMKLFLPLILLAAPAVAKTIDVAPGPDAQERLQTALIDVQPGDVVQLAAGRFMLTDGLSLAIPRVTVRGAGADKTVLDFKGQQGAGEGLLVTASDVVMRDFAVEDAKGDAIKSKGVERTVYKNLRVDMDRRTQGEQRRLRHLPGRQQMGADRRLRGQRRIGCGHLCRPVAGHHRPQQRGERAMSPESRSRTATAPTCFTTWPSIIPAAS